MNGGFSLGKIFGIEINIDLSWIFIFLLVVWNLALGLFPRIHPQWGVGLNWLVSVTAALVFFASVLIHELAHSLVAKARGLPVSSITLFIFGGVSNLQKEPESPATEFLTAIVGPISSIVLGAAFLLLGGLTLGQPSTALFDPGVPLSQLSPLSTILLWLGPINILLGIFNLIPGFPLDGGRVLRAFLWWITGSLQKATKYAAGVGQFVAWLFIFAGISMIFGIELPILGTGLIGGLWLVFIGWFLNNAASSSYQQLMVESILENVPVQKLMRSDTSGVSEDVSVDSLVHDYVLGTDKHAFPVTEGANLLGIVSLEDIRKIDGESWEDVKVKDIMTPYDQLDVTTPKEDISNALNKLVSRDVGQLPVVQDGKLVGMLTRRDLLLWLQLQSQQKEFKES